MKATRNLAWSLGSLVLFALPTGAQDWARGASSVVLPPAPIAPAGVSGLGSFLSATVDILGAPCDTATLSATLPNLGAIGIFNVDGAAPLSPGMLLFSDGAAMSSISGCDIFLANVFEFATFMTDSEGSFELVTDVPLLIGLLGQNLTFQSAINSGVGPVSALGYEVTNAVRLNFGEVAAGSGSTARLNELFISHSGIDDQEFIELIGDPAQSLDNHVLLIVEGDAGGAGTLDRAYDLTGHVLDANGFFTVGTDTVAGIGLALGADNLFENGTNTFYLVDAGTPAGVASLQAAVGVDLDEDDNLETPIPNMAVVLDRVGTNDSGVDDENFDAAPVQGPDGTFGPAGIFRLCDYPSDWSTDFLDFDDVTNSSAPRTPGGANTILDRGFEAGAFGGIWTEASTNFGTPICNVGGCGTGGGTGPDQGNFWAWFGGVNAFEIGSVEQSVYIPSDVRLTFRFEQPGSSGNGTDFLSVLIDGVAVTTILDGTAAPGYETVVVDLAGFDDGAVHLLRVESMISGVPNSSNFFVDELCWENALLAK